MSVEARLSLARPVDVGLLRLHTSNTRSDAIAMATGNTLLIPLISAHRTDFR